MARWRLIEPHYLKTKDATKWEYMETDRTTNRQKRVQYDVPRYLHPDDPADWTTREGEFGYIVVSDGHNAQPTDIIFTGDPTPGMLAQDDEAREISSRFSDRWAQPNTLLNPNEPDWAGRQMDAFIAQQQKINMKLMDMSSQSTPGMNEFMQTMTSIMKQNQEILMAVTAKNLGIKPVVDNLEPLDSPYSVRST